jgi:O-acetylhomoserine (thiol)-lyase
MNVPDISGIVEIAHSRGVVVIVDGTVTTPYLFDAKNFGIDVVVHSSTKLLSGGATSVGGVIIDLGTSTWSGFPSLKNHKRKGEWAFLARLRTEVYRDLGACMAPHTAYLQSLGLETLALRVEKVCDNTLKVAKLLRENKKIKTVNYPGLSESPYHALAKKQFKNRFGGVLSFELADKQTCFTFLNKLKIIKRASNLGDNTSLMIHPASTIFREYTPEKKESMGVSDELIRLSAGIENFEDLKKDIQQALE